MKKAIVFIDSECVLCEKITYWIARADTENLISVSAIGGLTYAQLTNAQPEKNHVILFHQGIWYHGPEVFFKLIDLFGFPYTVFKVFKVLPQSVQWRLYSYIAQNRYRYFGRKQTCEVLNPKVKEKFLP